MDSLLPIIETLNHLFAFLNANFLYLFLLQILFLVLAFTLIVRAAYTPTEKAVWIILILCFPLLGLLLFFILPYPTKKKEEPAANEPLLYRFRIALVALWSDFVAQNSG